MESVKNAVEELIQAAGRLNLKEAYNTLIDIAIFIRDLEEAMGELPWPRLHPFRCFIPANEKAFTCWTKLGKVRVEFILPLTDEQFEMLKNIARQIATNQLPRIIVEATENVILPFADELKKIVERIEKLEKAVEVNP